MTARECADNWKRTVAIYDRTRGQSPVVTADEIVKELGKDAAMMVFSTVTRIKRHDGRIYGEVRKVMDKTPFCQEATVWESGNPMVHAGLDDIHPTHINQIIRELIRSKEDD